MIQKESNNYKEIVHVKDWHLHLCKVRRNTVFDGVYNNDVIFCYPLACIVIKQVLLSVQLYIPVVHFTVWIVVCSPPPVVNGAAASEIGGA